MFERDYARRGYEINFYKRQYFIEDTEIEKYIFLRLFFRAVFSVIVFQSKLYYFIHRKEIQENIRKSNLYFAKTMKQIKPGIWVRK